MKKLAKKLITLSLLAILALAIIGCETETTTEAPPDNQTDTTQESTANESSENISSDFKSTMDSYEAFFDEYVAFMEKYAASDGTDLSLLTDYSTYMSKYADIMAELETLDTSNMSADELAYFTEVQARITEKISSIEY